MGPSAISYVFDQTYPGSALPPRMRRVKHLRARTVEEMKELRASFIRASGIAKSAGFYAIEIHGVHGLPSISPFRARPWGGFLAYLKGQVEKKVEVELPRIGHAEDLLSQNFDSVIVATGSSPRNQARYPEAKGVETAGMSFAGKAKLRR